MNYSKLIVALKQLDINHMNIEKTWLLADESISWVNIDNDIKTAWHVLNFRSHNQKTYQYGMTYQASCGEL